MNKYSPAIVRDDERQFDIPDAPCRAGASPAQAETGLSEYERAALENRTLPLESVDLLCEICRRQGLSLIFRSHTASASAEMKRMLVAPAEVQKTLTIRIGGLTVLLSAIGDPLLRRSELRDVGHRLGLSGSASRQIHINPGDISPLAQFGLPAGMVSPFLPPGRATILSAVVLVDAGAKDGGGLDLVALSLSLNWSLLIEARHLNSVVREYARTAYPWLPLLDLRRTA